MRDLVGKVAVVTGAASGIGRALAERFADEGMRVVLADIDTNGLSDAEQHLQERGKEVVAVTCDVGQWGDVEALAQRAVATFGAVHVVCNNAGVGTLGRCWEFDLAEWDRVLRVNLWGVIHGIRAFVPILIQQGVEAHIVNTASIAGFVTGQFHASYDISKHAVVALSEVLHRELAGMESPVSVSALSPGLVKTNFFASEDRRVGGRHRIPDAFTAIENAMQEVGISPETVADHVVDAIHEKRFYIFTDPRSHDAVRARMENILAGGAPL